MKVLVNGEAGAREALTKHVRHQGTKQAVNTAEDRIRIQDNYLRLEKKGLKTTAKQQQQQQIK